MKVAFFRSQNHLRVLRICYLPTGESLCGVAPSQDVLAFYEGHTLYCVILSITSYYLVVHRELLISS